MRRAIPQITVLAGLAALSLLAAAPAAAQVFDERFDDWPVDLRIRGVVVVASDLDDTGVLKEAVGPAPGKRRVSVLVDGAANETLEKDYEAVFGGNDDGDDAKRRTTVVRTSEKLGEQLAHSVERADVICWHAPPMLTVMRQADLRSAREALVKHIDAGRIAIAVGANARALGAGYVVANVEQPRVADGLGLLPDCVIATNYDDAADRGRLLAGLALRPRSVGIGIEKNTAIVLAGRLIRVVGSGTATFVLMANEREPLRVQKIAAPKSPRQAPEEFLVDLTEWRRDAIDRTLEPFPPERPGKPFVENGALVIVGGGGMPRGLMWRFVELAGGKEKAKLVYVPCAEEDEVGERHGTVGEWKRMGVAHTAFVHTKDRRRANEDDAFLAPLKEATGLWFGGGRQWNLSDSYYGTTAHRLMKDVLRRGGVIGGSSAGASIQARYLARGTPIGNTRIMAPGYERGGLGFLDGVAIDQHFSQRGRQRDMTELMARYPQLLGIGLDEATAIVVQKSTAEVVGNGQVFFYDRRQPVYPDRPDYVALPEGGRYELVERKVIAYEQNATADVPRATEP